MLERLFQTRAAFLAALLVIFAVQIAFRSLSEVNHDVAWYFHVTAGLANGKEMYRDFMEVNPPLAAWEMLPLQYMAGAFGLGMTAMFNVAIFGFAALSLALCNRYLAISGDFAPPLRRLAVVLIAVALLYFPGSSFGEREHVLAILLLPWLLLRVARAKGAGVPVMEALAIGMLAALGVCLKPHALLAPLAVEGALLALHRDWRKPFAPENIAAGLTAIAYLALARALAPAFFNTMLDLGVRAYVPFIGFDTFNILLGSVGTLGSLIVAVVLVRLSGTTERFLAAAGLAATFGLLAAYFLQGKGFSYQLLPSGIFAAVSALAILPGKPARDGRQAISRRLAVPMVAMLFAANVHGQSYFYLSDGFEDVIARVKPETRSVFIATTNLSLAFPFVTRNNYVWASRFPAQWLTPYVSVKWQGGALPADDIVTRALDWTVSDLTAFRPDVVIVDTSPEQAYVPGGKFDYIGFWSQDQRFAAFWKDYQLRDTIMDFAVYTRR